MSIKAKNDDELKELIKCIYNKLIEKCKKCGGTLKIYKQNENTYKCQNKLCKNKYNIYKDTIFYHKKIEKEKILKILELFMIKASNKIIEYITGISKKTIWKIFNHLAKCLVQLYYAQAEPIGGDGSIVQIDESKFGKRKYERGHKVEGVWVLGAVEKTDKRRIRLFVVDDRKASTLTQILTDNIYSDSIVHTDMWRGYVKLKDKFIAHGTVNHSQNFVDPVTGINTNTIEGEWSGIKIGVPFRGRTKAKIELYLVRYMILREIGCHPLDALLKYLF